MNVQRGSKHLEMTFYHDLKANIENYLSTWQRAWILMVGVSKFY